MLSDSMPAIHLGPWHDPRALRFESKGSQPTGIASGFLTTGWRECLFREFSHGHYDPWWNSAAEAQATDRAYRIGQDNPVFVHKLLCQDTVEQRIHQMQQEKANLAAGLLADAEISNKLSPKMVRALLE
jgi:hypothetical protein